MTRRWLIFLLAFAACRAAPPKSDSVLATGAAHPPVASDATTDGCRQTGGPRPDSSLDVGSAAQGAWRRAFARGAEFSCTIHPTLALRIVVAGDTEPPSLDSLIVLPERDAGPALQILHRELAEAEMPLSFVNDVVRTIDLDADGWRDLLVGKFWGATGNRGYDVWRFDQATRRFVADSALSTLWDPSPVRGRPCVSTHSHTSVLDDERGVHCLHAGQWLLDSAEVDTWQRPTRTVRHEIFARRGDSLVVIRSTTRPDSM
jgi:hypothetical protein